MRPRWLVSIERVLLALGLLLLAFYFAARTDGILRSRTTLREFKSEQLRHTVEDRLIGLDVSKPDFTLWSPRRIKDYESSLQTHTAPAMGILRVPRIHLEVPVFEGTDDLTLNRGLGWIKGTARPGEDGNVGIAGHRDGFFRGLKDVDRGDTIEIVTLGGARIYVIDDVLIVKPTDTSILAPRARPSLSLVTCYPFYFLGSAPERYIVQATMRDPNPIKHAAIETTNARDNEMGEQERAP